MIKFVPVPVAVYWTVGIGYIISQLNITIYNDVVPRTRFKNDLMKADYTMEYYYNIFYSIRSLSTLDIC